MESDTSARWNVEAEHKGDETFVRFAGSDVSFDAEDASAMEQQLMDLLEGAGRTHLVLDLSNVSYLTSSTLSVLLRLQKRLQSVGGLLALTNARPLVYEVFNVTRLTKVFEFRPHSLAAC
jgi:anti-sigma B factor antagonist